MLAWEDFTTYGEGNSLTIKDLTSYGLGARGIDVMIARRVSSDQSNDPLLTSSGVDTAVLGATSKDRVSFPLYDGHGNTIATLARNGTGYSIANVKRYDVWGKVRSDSSVGSSGQILNPTQKYCGNLGHKYDATSGLTYMRARYYEAETGRFISEDPAHEGVNWYIYCDSNPVGGVDYSGTNLLPELEALLKFVSDAARVGNVDQVLEAFKTMDSLKGLIRSAVKSAIQDFRYTLSFVQREDNMLDVDTRAAMTSVAEGKLAHTLLERATAALYSQQMHEFLLIAILNSSE